jgi:hypothetical protein
VLAKSRARTEKKKSKEKINKKLLAMTIDSDTNEGRRIAGSISRSYGVGENPSVYSYFERLFRPALRGDGLPFQRVGGECASFA